MQKHLPTLYVMAISALAACMTLYWWQGKQAHALLLAENQQLKQTQQALEAKVEALQARPQAVVAPQLPAPVVTVLARSHEHNTVVLGETFRADLGLHHPDLGPLAYERYRTLYFSSLGYVRQGANGPAPPQVEIPTEGLLEPGQPERIVTFYLHAVNRHDDLSRFPEAAPRPFSLRVIRAN